MGDEVVKAVSLDEISSMVRQAFAKTQPYEDDMTGCCWVMDVYPTYCVVSEGAAGKYCRVEYTLVPGGEVTFAPREQWQPVEREWVDAKAENMLVAFGGEVKSLPEDRIGGYLIVWGSTEERDLSGEYFTKATELCLDWYEKRPLLYHHGKEGTLKKTPVGFIDTLKADDTGLWMEAQLDARNRYVKAVKKLVDKGALGLSGATLGHLREVKSTGELICWPLIEGSLTPAQVEPRTYVVTLKSLPLPLELPNEPEVVTEGAVTPAPVAAASVKAVPVVQVISTDTHKQEGASMSENAQTQPPADSRVAQLEATVNGVSDRLDKVVKALEKLPQSQNPGVVSVDGGKADPEIKSLADFLVSVKRQDITRLDNVYKAMSEDQGNTGGFLVPSEYLPRFIEAAAQASQVVAGIENIPVTTPTGRIPSLDLFTAPTAGVGQVAAAGGLKTTERAEGGAYTETALNLELVEYRLNSVGGYVKVSNELIGDSPISIESLLTRYIGVGHAAKKEYYVLNGNGVGQPLGIRNSAAKVTVAAASSNTFAYADAAKMLSRFKPIGNKCYWIMHKSTIEDISKFEVGTGGAVWIANLSAGFSGMPLLGYPILFSEHLPKVDNSGHVVLADLSAYATFSKGGLTIAYSEHADFNNGNGTWRFDERLDGQPLWKGVYTDANPNGSYTESPFVVFTN